MFMLSQLIQMAPDVEIGGGTYSGNKSCLYKAERPGLFLSVQDIHTSSPSPCCDVTKVGTVTRPWGARSTWGEGRYKKSPDLAKPLRAADVDCNNTLCRFTINVASIL